MAARKIAIFVEGQAELITVREFLLKKYNYSISLNCYKLFSKNEMGEVPFQWPNPEASLHYQIVQVGNDVGVLSAMLIRQEFMWKAGYEKLIGLRDMYSAEYKKRSDVINENVNQLFVNAVGKAIEAKSSKPGQITMCFSIMEIESWYLAMHPVFEKMDERLTTGLIHDKLGYDLNKVNPETEFFHPAKTLSEIFTLTGTGYNKRAGQIESLCGLLTTEDFERLYNSANCNSFNIFHNAVCVN